MKISSSGSRVVPCGRTERQDKRTDMTKLTVAFRSFTNAPKNDEEPTSYCLFFLSVHEDKPSLCPSALLLCPTKQNHSVSGLREVPTSAGFSYHLLTRESKKKKKTGSRFWLLDYMEQNRTETAKM